MTLLLVGAVYPAAQTTLVEEDAHPVFFTALVKSPKSTLFANTLILKKDM